MALMSRAVGTGMPMMAPIALEKFNVKLVDSKKKTPF